MSAPARLQPDPDVPSTVAVAGAQELPPGTTLQGGRYVIGSVLGRGGFGITYATDDRRLGLRVAVKELFPDGVARQKTAVVAPPHLEESFRAAKARFLREAAVLARFTHPGIVRVYEVFEENGTAYLVMELLDGQTLAQLLAVRGGPVSEQDALDLAYRVAQALVVVHRGGILHRDLNPSNIIVTSGGRVVLIDFGLAHAFDDHTGAMTRMVTPGYAPLEQYAGEGHFGPSTDVYGLAATLYRMLTGRAPVAALDREHGMALPSPHRLNPMVSRLVSNGVLDGLELQAAHRPQTTTAFLDRLGIGTAPRPTRAVPVVDGSAQAAPAPAPLDPNATQASGTRAQPPDARPDWVAPPDSAAVAPPAVEASPFPAPFPAPYRRPGLNKIVIPALVVVAAIGATEPIGSLLAFVFLVLPGLATAGDGVVYVRVRRDGGRLRWRDRMTLPAFLPARFVRNVGGIIARGMPGELVAIVGLVITAIAGIGGVSGGTQEALLRPVGTAALLLVVVPVARDRAAFRVAVVGDFAARRLLEPDGRLTRAGIALWVVAALLALAAGAFHPDLWPL